MPDDIVKQVLRIKFHIQNQIECQVCSNFALLHLLSASLTQVAHAFPKVKCSCYQPTKCMQRHNTWKDETTYYRLLVSIVVMFAMHCQDPRNNGYLLITIPLVNSEPTSDDPTDSILLQEKWYSLIISGACYDFRK